MIDDSFFSPRAVGTCRWSRWQRRRSQRQDAVPADIQRGLAGLGHGERYLRRDGKRTGGVLQTRIGATVRRVRRQVRRPGQDPRSGQRGGQRDRHVVAEPFATQRRPVPVRDDHDRLETGTVRK